MHSRHRADSHADPREGSAQSKRSSAGNLLALCKRKWVEAFRARNQASLSFGSRRLDEGAGTLCRTYRTHNDKPDGGVLQPSLLLPACWGGGGSTARRGSRGGGRFDGRNLRREEEEEQEEDVSRFLVLG